MPPTAKHEHVGLRTASDAPTVSLPGLSSIPWGTHFCLFYEELDDMLDVVLPFFEEGLQANEFALWITHGQPDPAAALGIIRNRLPDGEEYLRSHAIEVVSADDWYFTNGEFDADHAVRTMALKLKSALDRGFVGMRAHGNEEWLRHEHWAPFRDYEAILDQSLKGERAMVLCTYPLGKATGMEILDAAKTHDFAIARRRGEWQILETSSSIGAKSALEQLNSRLEELVQERTANLALTTAELEESNGLYRFITATINEIISIYDTDGHRIYLSPSAERMLGYIPDDKFSEMYPADRPRAEQFWMRLLEGKSANIAFRIRHADGSLRWLECDARPGEFNGRQTIIGVARDVSERVKFEELYRFIAENINEIIALFEADGTRIYISDSAERLLGHLPAADFSGVHPNDRGRVDDAFAQVLGGKTVTITFRQRHSDGSWRWLEFTGKPAEFEGKPRLIAVGRDATQRIRLEEQLSHAQKMEALGRLAGGVAHDFNNLLTAIYGFGELVAADVLADSPAYRNVREIQRAIERAQGVTRQLLTFSRRETLQPQTIDLGVTTTRMQRMLRLLLREDIRLHVHSTNEPLLVLIDGSQVEQLIINLVSNAADATPAGGAIDVRSDRISGPAVQSMASGTLAAGDYARLRVTDSGAGMAPEIVEKAFDPFFTTKPAGVGTGLGLSTVFGIVRQAGGDVWIESEEGAGTTVTVLLPIASVAAEAQSQSASGPTILTGKAILVVEDEDLVRSLIEQVLQREGANATVTSDPRQASEILSNPTVHIDMLVTDVIMPRMSGPSLATFARKVRPDLPVLLISGYTADERVMSGVEVKWPLLEKPFRPEELIRAISYTLNSPPHRARRPRTTKRKD